jgi:hypothetical protein
MHFSLLRRTHPAPDSPPGALHRVRLRAALWAALALLPSIGRACACGCGIYEVGTGSMVPTGSGVSTFLDYNYQDQDRNWSGDSRAPAADNPDRDIRTSAFTYGFQDMFSRSWGIRLEVPYEVRHFETVSDAPGSPLADLNFRGLGDIRIEGIYTGLSPDLSTGLVFGVKLPTGSFTHNDAAGDIDRDTEIGSGSTDLLLGAYRRFNLGTDYGWSGILQGVVDIPVLTQAQYRPGVEGDAAVGVYYNGLSIGRMRISPVGLLKISVRGSDSGAGAASPVASGFERLLVAPGVELDWHPLKVYGDIELPLLEHVTGNQLTAPVLVRLSVAYMF